MEAIRSRCWMPRGRGGIPWFAGERVPNDDYSANSQAYVYSILLSLFQILKSVHILLSYPFSEFSSSCAFYTPSILSPNAQKRAYLIRPFIFALNAQAGTFHPPSHNASDSHGKASKWNAIPIGIHLHRGGCFQQTGKRGPMIGVACYNYLWFYLLTVYV